MKSADYRWRKHYKTEGVLALEDSRKENSGRPRIRELTLEEKYERLKAKNKLLEAENDLLKKLEMRESVVIKNRNIKLKSSEKFVLINEIIKKYNLKNMNSYLCEISDVSRSGYYNYFSEKSQKVRKARKVLDIELRNNILKAYNYKGCKKGAQQIKLTLKNIFGINYNLKRIR